MNNDSHVLNKLEKLVRERGKVCLLPHNLPDDILQRIEDEAIALGEDNDSPPPSALFMAVLELKNKSPFTKSWKIEVSPDELMDNFYVYSSSVRIEILRRKGKVDFAEESFPTLENILDGSRNMNISGIENIK